MSIDLTNEFESDRPTRQRAKTDTYYKTGSTLVDLLVGGGMSMGFPSGRIVNFYGESGSGKTFFGCELIAAAHRQYKDKFHWVYDDAERGFSFDGEKMWGVNILGDNPVRSNTVEDLYYNVRKFLRDLKDDECGIYVVDSLDALSNADNEEIAEARMKAGDRGEAYDKGTYGMSSQKFLSQEFFRKIAKELDDKNSLLVFVSQLRDNVNAGLYGKKRRKSGGSALDFYCDTIVELKTKEKFTKNDRVYGVCVEAELTKSKTSRPFRSALINVLFDYGIDDISSNIDYLFDLKTDMGKLVGKTTCNLGDTSDPRYGKYELTLEGIKNVLTDENLYDEAVASLKANDIKRTKDGYINWIKENHADVFKAYYGEPIERAELIALADKDKSVRRMLKARVVDKWEDIEASLLTGRRKYDDEEDD